jgi:hypothetical protein
VPPTDEERLVYASFVFESEGFDPRWANESRSTILTGLEGLATKGTRIEGVECRSSLCRVQLKHDSPDIGETFLKAFIRGKVWPSDTGLALRSQPDGSGKGGMTIYLAKQGTSLPVEPPTDD